MYSVVTEYRGLQGLYVAGESSKATCHHGHLFSGWIFILKDSFVCVAASKANQSHSNCVIMVDFPAKVNTETSSHHYQNTHQGGLRGLTANISNTMDMSFIRSIPAILMMVEMVRKWQLRGSISCLLLVFCCAPVGNTTESVPVLFTEDKTGREYATYFLC